MKQFKIFIFILVTLNLFGCYDHKQPKANSILFPKDTLGNIKIRKENFTISNKIDSSSIKVDFFRQLPSSISESNGEFYTYDTTKLSYKKYIFLSDLVTFAIVKINGTDIYLRKDYQKSIELSKNTFQDVYTGKGYTILLTFHLNKHLGDGVSYNKGTLEVRNSKYRMSFKVHGYTIV